MIAYTTVGTNDYEKAQSFYNDLFGEIGVGQLWASDTFAGYGTAPDQPMFAICKPNDGLAATNGNGTMIALKCETKDQVQKLHAKATSLGGADEGAPGPRGDAFYMAYARDLDGNKLAFYTPNK